MHLAKLPLAIVFFSVSLNLGCRDKMFQPEPAAPPAMNTIPAVRLNYRYEADVPAPPVATSTSEERSIEVQADFDKNRAVDELLERTILSPDKKHVLAVYRNVRDAIDEYRLDVYSPEGRLEKKLTSDTMAVYFPETIVWSPDSSSLAFVAKTRAVSLEPIENIVSPPSDAADSEGDANSEGKAVSSTPTAALPTGILTFRTQQIYTCNSDGSGLKPLTENEGMIYFYYAWSPDGSMLVALATTVREWRFFEITAESKGEMMIPLGRPRVIEKNGRERRLDDNATAVQPVWSPDSSKVAAAFETQVRIYDAVGTNPTQAAIPLRNQLLISSQAYDRDLHRQTSNSDANQGVNLTATPDQPLSTLPDQSSLVSFNPIFELLWLEEAAIYLKTAYVKRMKNPADNVTSFARWHKLPLSVQIAASPAK